MSMTLTSQNVVIAAKPYQNVAKQVGELARTNLTRRNSGDAVADAIDPVATLMAGVDDSVVSPAGSIMADVVKTDDVRWDKIAALRQAIADGTYGVSAEDVAEKIMAAMAK